MAATARKRNTAEARTGYCKLSGDHSTHINKPQVSRFVSRHTKVRCIKREHTQILDLHICLRECLQDCFRLSCHSYSHSWGGPLTIGIRGYPSKPFVGSDEVKVKTSILEVILFSTNILMFFFSFWASYVPISVLCCYSSMGIDLRMKTYKFTWPYKI